MRWLPTHPRVTQLVKSVQRGFAFSVGLHFLPPPTGRARAHSMATNIGLMRLKKELKMLYEDPPPGISAWAQEENFHEIEAGAAHTHPTQSLRALVRLLTSVPTVEQ